MNPLRRLSDRWRREHRTGLNHHIPMPDDIEALASAAQCMDCVWRGSDRIPCDRHDGAPWDSFERRYYQP